MHSISIPSTLVTLFHIRYPCHVTQSQLLLLYVSFHHVCRVSPPGDVHPNVDFHDVLRDDLILSFPLFIFIFIIIIELFIIIITYPLQHFNVC